MKTKLFSKKIRLFILFLALCPVPCALSQIPQGFNYQAVARDPATGYSITGAQMKVQLTIQTDSLPGPGIIIWQETHNVTTNNYGLFNVIIGKGTRVGGAFSFSQIDWTAWPKYFIRNEIEYPKGSPPYKLLGVSRLWSVPFAMVAGEFDGPVKKLAVKGETTSNEEALFEVKNKDGQTVFAVYNEGVRVYVADGSKAIKGGFSVGGFGTDKAGESTKYMFVGKDSVRIYLDTNPLTKAKKGGFAVGGYDLTKGGGVTVQNYLDVSADSIRMYINDKGKATKGGFAVGGFDVNKGGNVNFLNIATDAGGVIYPAQNRVLWYPLLAKNAFLVGRVLIHHPDSIGVNSVTTGYESRAKGMYSQALGFQSIARGNYSTAIGKNATAHKNNSFAFGNQAKAMGDDSYALGTGAKATGPQSFALGSSKMNDSTGVTVPTVASGIGAFALGFGAVATGDGAFAMGVLDTASGPGSLSMGYYNKSLGWFSTSLGAGTTVEAAGWQGLATGLWTRAGNWAAASFGDQTYASGHTSFATGFRTVASGHLAATFGDQTVAPSWGSLAIGKFNSYSGSAEGWNSGDPLFMVGIGTSTAARKNAMTVFKNGVTEFNHGTVIDYDRMELNSSGTGNRVSYIDFHSDNTYTDYSFRIFRNAGLNGTTDFAQRGLGDLNFITFEDADISFITYGYERMRVRSNGFVGINTYPAYQLDVAGSININKGLSGIGALYVNGAEAIWYNGHYSWGYGGTYNVFNSPMTVGGVGSPGGYYLWVAGNAWSAGSFINGSDIRWKKNITEMGSVLNKITMMNGVTYEWRNDEFPDLHFDQGMQIGLIAQDVEKIFPELVKTDDKGYKGVNYDKLSVLLLEGIKEQQKKIESQELENQQLKSELQALREEMNQIKAMLVK